MDGGAWQVLGDLPAWQVTQIPRSPHAGQGSGGGQDQADRGAAQRLQALVSAFHSGAPVGFGWLREHPGGPVRVLAAGPALAGGAGAGQVVLTLPAGAGALPLPAGRAAARLGGLPCWVRLAGVSDALLAGPGGAGRNDRDARPSLEDGLLSAWSGPFGWLVLAEPVTAARIGELAEEAELMLLGAQRSDSPLLQLAARRLSARHTELGQAPATGLWRVRFAAGGSSPAAAAQVAGLVCASADLDGLPYGLALPLGAVLDWNRVPAGELAVPRASLNRHVFVCGATGAGKSQTVRALLEAATGAGIPWLVVEPAKAEYRLMAARLPGTQVIRIRPGELGDPPAGINPLEPAPGPDGARFGLQAHADLVRALFLAAFAADEPFPQVLAAALTRCYERAGWDLVTGQPATPGLAPGYPALEDLQAAALAVVGEIGYGREITDNVRGFVTVRIASLRQGTTGRFFQGGHPLDFAALLESNVVFEIEDAGDDRDKAFLMGTVLIRLAEYLRLRHRAEGATAPRLGRPGTRWRCSRGYWPRSAPTARA